MATSQQYGLEFDDDDDANDVVMRNVVNITDEEVRFRIATVPGSKPLRYKLAPFGKPGSTISMQGGYTLPYRGAGTKMMAPIIEKLTSRHVGGHEGAKLPMVVEESKAQQARSQWLSAMRAHKQTKDRKPVTVALSIDPVTNMPSAARVETPIAPKVKAAPVLRGEEVGDEPIDPVPPPEDDDPIEPVEVSGPPSGPEPEPVEA